jgi:hypothetical protein
MLFHRSAFPVSRHNYPIIPIPVLIRLGIVEYQRAGQVRDGGDVRPAGQVSGCLDVESLVDPTLDSERARTLRNQPGRLGRAQHPVQKHIFQLLHGAGWPFDAEGVHRDRQEILERLWQMEEATLLHGGAPDPAETALLDRELIAFEQDTQNGSPWREVLSRIRTAVSR